MAESSAPPIASAGKPGRCGSCRFWQPAPTFVPGCEGQEKICGLSRQMGRVDMFYGQDGRAVITPEEYGCIHYSAKGS